MANTNGQKVLDVLAAIRTQNTDEALRHVAPHFVQHYPHIGDGLDGLRQFITGSTPDQLKLTIVRLIEDGPYVVTQLRSESTGEHMFATYRFADGLIAEHWIFSSPDAPPNESGHTQMDGPTKPEHLAETEKNKAFLRRYYETFHLAGDRDHNDEFFKGDLMIRHEPGVRDGLHEFLSDVTVLMQDRTIDELKLLVGQGDLVFIGAEGTQGEKPCVYIDLYRVEDQRVVEHWGFPQNIPPRSESKNSNGML